jgi:hypothetical protein
MGDTFCAYLNNKNNRGEIYNTVASGAVYTYNSREGQKQGLL